MAVQNKSVMVNKDLLVERNGANFDVKALSAYIFGGKEKVARREFLAGLLLYLSSSSVIG